MPINYSYEGGNARLETDNPIARERLQFQQGFTSRAPMPRRGTQGGMPIRGGAEVDPRSQAMSNADIAEAHARSRAASAGLNAQATNSGDIAMSPMGRRGKMTPYGFVESGALGNFTTSPTVSPDRFAAPLDPSKWKMHSGGVNFGPMAQEKQPDATDEWYSLPDHIRKAMLIDQGFGKR